MGTRPRPEINHPLRGLPEFPQVSPILERFTLSDTRSMAGQGDHIQSLAVIALGFVPEMYLARLDRPVSGFQIPL